MAATTLTHNDFEKIVQLLDWVLNPGDQRTIPERRRDLMRGLCELVDADVWMWSNTIGKPEAPGDFFTTCFLDDGWTSQDERMRAYALLTSADFSGRFFQKISQHTAEGRRGTWFGTDIVPEDRYADFESQWATTGLAHCLYSIYPLGETRSSSSGIHRKIGKPAFAERDRRLVETVLAHVDSLHRYGDNEAEQETSISLTNRERMTLVLLLSGLSYNAIAGRLGISQHTVNDYVKTLHRVYGVKSRAELQAKFFLGGNAEIDRLLSSDD